MRFITYVLFLIVVFVSSTSQLASAMETPLALAKKQVKTIQSELKQYANAHDDSALIEIIDSTQILFSKALSIGEVAFSSVDNGRNITISERYLLQLAAFIQKKLEPSDDASFDVIFVTALSDVILHEIGHHAQDSFYTQYTPPAYIPMLEDRAQFWAEQAKQDLNIDPSGYGRLVTLYSLLDNSHRDPNLSWQATALGFKIQAECHNPTGVIANKLCHSLQRQAQRVSLTQP